MVPERRDGNWRDGNREIHGECDVWSTDQI